jgi:hypothetical protein
MQSSDACCYLWKKHFILDEIISISKMSDHKIRDSDVWIFFPSLIDSDCISVHKIGQQPTSKKRPGPEPQAFGQE